VTDPYVLGVGTAAFRDVAAFFKYEAQDEATPPTANPLAGAIKGEIIRGSSQSGNFTRHYIHLGMNQDEKGRIVHDGAWPLIAGRRVANNSRWDQPDGVLELYQMGSEGPQWWHQFPDTVRGLRRERRDGRADERAAADPARHQDARAKGRRRWQRARRRTDRSTRRPARHLSRLEHHGGPERRDV
jgi:hypothetical protein